MPIFVATIASVSAHSFLSLLASTSDASSTSSSSSSSFILPLKSPSKRSSIFPSRVSLSGKPDPIAGVLDTSPESVRRARRSADWKAAREYLDSGFIYEGRIEGSNAGGLLVIQADEKNRKLIFSEKEAARSKFSGQVAVGDVYEGKVGSVEDYGAFVHLRLSDGLYHLTGLVHVSEVSWDLVQDVRDILSEGDEVTVKVINVNKNKSRITLSIRQLEEDPLLETLDKVIPQDSSAEPDSFGPKGDSEIIPLPGLETIIEELLQEEGIVDVRVNRQGFEKRVVSQDLQLWLSNAPPVEKKFTLLARAGRQVQEIQLTTSLDQEGIKRALQRVLERVP